MVSAWAGFFVDMFDIYLPVVALAPALSYFQPSSLTAGQVSFLFFSTFAATLVGRPVGALVFGHFADTIGRRRLTLVSVAGFSGCTLAIAVLPGYASWGVAAPLALLGLRFLDGVFLGGEYTSATPLAFEHCPPAGRGLFGGLLMGAYAIAYLAISAIVLLLLELLPASDYAVWGWRIPFVLGGLLGLVFLAYRARVPESDRWQQTSRSSRPVTEVVLGRFRRDLGQVLLLMCGLWFLSTSVVSVMPRLLVAELGRTPQWVTGVLLVAQVAVFAAFAAVGALSQIIGRRRTLAAGAVVAGTLGLGLYAELASSPHSPGATVVLAVGVQVVVLGVWGVVTSYCNERFPTSVRSSGFGLGYTVAVVPASFYPFYLAALDRVMPSGLTQLVLLAVGAVLTLAGALLGPETVGADLDCPPTRV
jgi:MFS family permease